MIARVSFALKVAALAMPLSAVVAETACAYTNESAASILGKLNESASGYLRALARARGEAETVTKTGPRSDPKVILGDLSFRRHDGRILVRRVLRSDKDPSLFREVVFASDLEYQFLIERLDETKPFELRSFRAVKTPAVPGFDDFYPTLNRFLLAPVSISSVPAPDIVKSPHFRLGRAEAVSAPGGGYRVHYEFDDPSLVFGPGWFEVSPASGWLITKSSCRYGDRSSKSRAMATIDYGLDYAGQSMPSHVNIFQGYDKSPHVTEDDFHLKSIADDESTPADFRPAKFGLPDPSRLVGKGKGFSTDTLLVILSPVVLLGAIVLRHLAHRRSRELGSL